MPRRQPLIAAAAAAALLFFCSYYKANPPSPRSPDLLSSSYLCVYREVPAPLCEEAAPPLHSPCGSTAPEASRQTWLLPSEGRALRPSTPGDFLPDEKVTKESPRGGPPLGTPPRGTERKVFHFSLPLPLRRCRHPLDRVSATKIDRFATLSLWANRSCFFLWFHRGNTLCFQSVARQDCPRGCRRFYTSATNTARAQGRGIKGGYAPFAGGPGTRRFLAYLCLLSLREKVGRGRRGGAPSPLRVWELCSHMGERRGGASPLASVEAGALGKERKKRW